MTTTEASLEISSGIQSSAEPARASYRALTASTTEGSGMGRGAPSLMWLRFSLSRGYPRRRRPSMDATATALRVTTPRPRGATVRACWRSS